MAFRVNDLPAAARAAFAYGPLAWMLVVQECIKAGMTNADELASIVFYLHHPERGGKPIQPSEKTLVEQWKAFRDLIKPLLVHLPASNKPSKFPSVTSSEYIRWVKASLNRVLGTTLPDNAVDTLEYRYWIKEFQINQHLPGDGLVGKQTQDALMMRSRYNRDFVIWVQRCLNHSGEAEGKLPVSGFWTEDTTHILKVFQGNEETRNGEPLEDDGWVGVKTEWALYRRTGLPPPGRYKVRPKPDKPMPSPRGWSDSLDPTLRTQVWLNGMDIELETDPLVGPEDPDVRHQWRCFLGKLKKGSGIDYAYLTKDRVVPFVIAKDPTSKFSADDITSDAKEEIVSRTSRLQRQPYTYSEAYWHFREFVWQVFRAVTIGLNTVAKYASGEDFGFEPRVVHLRGWVVMRQKDKMSILSCFI